MRSRDAPKMTTIVGNPAIFEPFADTPVLPSQSPTKTPPASRLIPTPKQPTATSGRRAKKPSSKQAKKPIASGGFEWRKNGAGWDLRKVIWIEDATSGKQRKRPYLGHLSKSAFAEMKKANK